MVEYSKHNLLKPVTTAEANLVLTDIVRRVIFDTPLSKTYSGIQSNICGFRAIDTKTIETLKKSFVNTDIYKYTGISLSEYLAMDTDSIQSILDICVSRVKNHTDALSDMIEE